MPALRAGQPLPERPQAGVPAPSACAAAAHTPRPVPLRSCVRRDVGAASRFPLPQSGPACPVCVWPSAALCSGLSCSSATPTSAASPQPQPPEAPSRQDLRGRRWALARVLFCHLTSELRASRSGVPRSSAARGLGNGGASSARGFSRARAAPRPGAHPVCASRLGGAPGRPPPVSAGPCRPWLRPVWPPPGRAAAGLTAPSLPRKPSYLLA